MTCKDWFFAAAGFSGLKAHRHLGCDGHRPAVHYIWLKLPQLYAIDGGVGKGQRALHKLCVLDGAVAADQHLKDDGSLLALRVSRIGNRSLIGEQSALGRFGHGNRLNRRQCRFWSFIAADFRSHGGHLRTEARRNWWIAARRNGADLRLLYGRRLRLWWFGLSYYRSRGRRSRGSRRRGCSG